MDQPLMGLRKRHGREVDHRMSREQVEVCHRLVGTRDELIDLARLRTQELRISTQVIRIR